MGYLRERSRVEPPGTARGWGSGGREGNPRRLGPGKLGRALRWTAGLGSGRFCSEARLITPARVCLCVSLIFPSIHPSGFLPLSVRLSDLGISAPRPFPHPCWAPALPACPPAGRTHRRGSRGSPVPSPGRRGARQLLLVRFPRMPASLGGFRARRQPRRPRPAFLCAARLPAPQTAPARADRCEASSATSTAGPRRTNPWLSAASAPPSAPGSPQPALRVVPIPLLPTLWGFRRVSAPHRTAAAAAATLQTRRGAQGPAAPTARFLETLALSFGGMGAEAGGGVETPA